MRINEVLAISGQPGLYKYVANSRNGIIVESLADSKRAIIPQTAKVSSFGDIAIYTIAEDIPLTEVLAKMAELLESKPAIDHKSSEGDLKELFEKTLPDYDKDRVRISDIKKVIQWYNILIGAGITDFSSEAATAEQE